MNASWYLSELASAWPELLLHSLWQSSLIAIAALALVWLLRRRSAVFLYAILMVALIKFLVPPIISLPVLDAENEMPVITPPAFDVNETAYSTDRQIASHFINTYPLATGSASTPEPAEPEASIRFPAFISDWRVWFAIAYLLGIASLLFIMGTSLRHLRRIVQNSLPAGESLASMTRDLAERMKLGHTVSVHVSPSACAPMATGVFRRRIILPEVLTHSLEDVDLRAILGHELAHHRRWDVWCIWLEHFVLLLWWFNPLVWLLIREIHRKREDCCDDIVLSLELAANGNYCQTLLRAAKELHAPVAPRLVFGCANKLHPMAQRLMRIMDRATRRHPALTVSGLIGIVVLGLILLPTFLPVAAEPTAEPQAAAETTPSVWDGLVAYFPFDGNANDRSGNDNHGDIRGATLTSDRFGNPESAYRFVGQSSIVVPHSSSLDIHGEASLSVIAWVRPDGGGSYQGIANKWGSKLDEDDQFTLLLAGNGVAFWMSDWPPDIYQQSRTGGGSVAVGSWHQVAGVYDKDAQRIIVYVNGAEAARKDIRVTLRRTEEPLLIGMGEIPSFAFRGDIDDVRIYSRALSGEEIKKLYTPATATAASPAPVAQTPPDPVSRVEEEIQKHYTKADAEVQEYIRWTARTFTRGNLWYPHDAFANLSAADREQKITSDAEVLQGDYGRHLCGILAEAGALKDERLLPGLIKVASYHREDSDYDCRPKWMAVSALGRQDNIAAVPTLIPLVDHGNQNTRMWARASLARLTGEYFGADKQAWGKWWNDSSHEPKIDLAQLKPWTPPPGVQQPQAPAGPIQTESAVIPPESQAIVDTLEGELAVKATYAHRSRGGDVPQPSTVWLKRTTDGETIGASYLPGFNSTMVARISREPRFHRYETNAHGRDGQPPSKTALELKEGSATVTYTGGEKDGQSETSIVPANAIFIPNTRPDPYIAWIAMYFHGPFEPAESITCYDWDNSGKGMAAYTIKFEDKGMESVTVPAGTFNARHYVETQTSFGDTWYKKRPGHVTDYWVLENGVVARILRHREPYELQLVSIESKGFSAAQPAAKPDTAATQPEIPSSVSNLNNDELRAAVKADHTACREYRDRHRKSVGFLEEHAANRLAYWQEGAKRGIPEAQTLLALCYSYGVGTTEYQAWKGELLQRAAEAGDAIAMFNLAQAYDTGKGRPQNRDEGFKWYQKAIDAGDSAAMWHMAWYLQRGDVVSKDEAKAIELLRQSAELGNARGMLLLGDSYRNGLGIEKNDAEALKLYQKAAALGYDEAEQRLKEIGAPNATLPQPTEPTAHIGVVRGVVVDARTGDPIAGAFVAIDHSGDAGGANLDRFREQGTYVTAVTGADGKFLLERVALLEAHPFYATAPGYVRDERTIALSKEHPQRELDVRLAAALILDVTASGEQETEPGGVIVVRLTQVPIPTRFFEANYLFRPPKDDWPALPYRTVPVRDGRVRFDDLPMNAAYKVEAMALAPSSATYLGCDQTGWVNQGGTIEIGIRERPAETYAVTKIAPDPYRIGDQSPMVVLAPASDLALPQGKFVHPESETLGNVVRNAIVIDRRLDKNEYRLKGFPPGKYTLVVATAGQYPNFKSVAVYPRWATFELREHEDLVVEIPWVEPTGPEERDSAKEQPANATVQ